MKTKILILLTIIPFLTACNFNSQKGNSNGGQKSTNGPVKDGVVVEGVINGGGGKGVLCTKVGVSKLEVLDIYEGRSLYEQTYGEVENKGFQELVTVFENKMTEHFSGYFAGEWESDDEDSGVDIPKILADAKFTKPGQSLKSTNDSDEPFIDEGCELVQIAVYYDEAVLLIDQDYWDLLDDFNKASLLSHELIYAHKRRQGETNSISTRRFLSHLLSDDGLTPRTGPKELKKEDVLICQTDQSYHGDEFLLSFFVYQSGEGEVTFALNTIGNEYPLLNVSAVVKEKNLMDFVSPVSDVQSMKNFKLIKETSSLPFGYLEISNFFRAGIRDRSGFEIKIDYMKDQKNPIKQKIECMGFVNKEKTDLESIEHIRSHFSDKILTQDYGKTISFSQDHELVKSLKFDHDQFQIVKKTAVIRKSDAKEICATVQNLQNWKIVWFKRVFDDSKIQGSYSPNLLVESSSVEMTGDLSQILNPNAPGSQSCAAGLVEAEMEKAYYMDFGSSYGEEYDPSGLSLGGVRYQLNL